MPSQAWKYLERKVAKDIRGERILQKGMSVLDVRKGNLLIECKNRKNVNISNEIRKMMAYRSDAKAIKAFIHRVSGAKTINVYMLRSQLEKLLIQIGLQKKDFIIRLKYRDFVTMAEKVKRDD